MANSQRAKERLRATAHHEAGHAVMAWWLNLPFRRVTIKPEGDSLGHLLHNKLPKRFNPEIEKSNRVRLLAERHIIASFSGQLAEAKHAGRSPRYGMHSDNRFAVDMATFFCGSTETTEAYLRFCFFSSRDLVIRWWSLIEAVATELLKRETLTSKEVDAAIKAASAVPAAAVSRPPGNNLS